MKPRKTKPTAQEVANIAGVSLTLVNRKLAQGRSPRQIIAEAEAQAQAAAQKRVVNVEVNGHTNGHAANAPNGAWSYAAAQAAKEGALCELRQLELMERRRELIPVSYVRQWGSRFLIEGRDILLNGLGELQDRLAVESDPGGRVEQILRFWRDCAMERFFSLETLWGVGELLDQDALRERFDTAKLSVVKPRDGKPRR